MGFGMGLGLGLGSNPAASGGGGGAPITTTLISTNGTRKDPNLTVSGNTATATRNANDAAGATAKTTTPKFIVEFTMTGTSTAAAHAGIDDGTFDMSAGTSPGLSGEGISVEFNTVGSPSFHMDGTDQSFFGSPVASPLVVTFVVDTTTGTNNVKIYYTITGTTTLIKTLSWTPSNGQWWAWAGGINSGASVTVNFGATAFTYSPSGYSAYG